MKQLKITLSLFIFTSLSLSAVAHANLVNAGESFMRMAQDALSKGFAHTPRQQLLDLLEAERAPLGRGDTIDNIRSSSLKKEFKSFVQKHYLELTRKVIPEKGFDEVIAEDPIVQALLRAGQELDEREFRTFITEILEPFMRMSDDQSGRAASETADSGIVETNG